MVLGDDVRVRAYLQLRDIHPARTQRVEFFEEHRDIDNHAICDHRRDTGGQDAGGQQVQSILFVADNDGVPGIVSAVELDHVVDAAAEQVCRLAFAFVAPLRADKYDRWHVVSPLLG